MPSHSRLRLVRVSWKPGVPLWHQTWGLRELNEKGARVWIARDGVWWCVWP